MGGSSRRAGMGSRLSETKTTLPGTMNVLTQTLRRSNRIEPHTPERGLERVSDLARSRPGEDHAVDTILIMLAEFVECPIEPGRIGDGRDRADTRECTREPAQSIAIEAHGKVGGQVEDDADRRQAR